MNLDEIETEMFNEWIKQPINDRTRQTNLLIDQIVISEGKKNENN